MLRFRVVSRVDEQGGRLGAGVNQNAAVGDSCEAVDRGSTSSTYSVIHGEGGDGLYQLASCGLGPEFPAPGVRSFRDLLASTSVEVSFLRVPPGAETPYALRHRRNEVVCIVTGGRGQFLIDGEAVAVAPGTVLRIAPAAIRAWRNVSSEDLLLILVQGRAGSLRRSFRSDAIGVPGPIPWWRHPWRSQAVGGPGRTGAN